MQTERREVFKGPDVWSGVQLETPPLLYSCYQICIKKIDLHHVTKPGSQGKVGTFRSYRPSAHITINTKGPADELTKTPPCSAKRNHTDFECDGQEQAQPGNQDTPTKAAKRQPLAPTHSPDGSVQSERARSFCEPRLLQILQAMPAHLIPFWTPAMKSRHSLESRKDIVEGSVRHYSEEERKLTEARDRSGLIYVQACEKLAACRSRKAELSAELLLIKQETTEAEMSR
ncbi:hypothetical protein PG984_011217 [Apiospora sp. TS-2023a]